jgi:biotin carboxyl carrier protein
MVVAGVYVGHGAGLLLSALAVTTWYVIPVGRFVKDVVQRWSSQPSRRRSFAWRMACLATLGVWLFAAAPIPRRSLALGTVDYRPLDVLRAPVSGYVDRILVDEEEHVQPGQSLVEMCDERLAAACAELRLSIEECRILERMARVAGQLAAANAHRQNQSELEKQLQQKLAQHDALVVRAPRLGRVVDCQHHELIGVFVDQGRELLCVGDEDHKELRAVLPEADYPTVRPQVGQPISLRLEDGRWFGKCGVLEAVLPYASKEPPSPGLSAAHGGQLSVTAVPADGRADGEAMEVLTEPRFVLIITLDATTSRQLQAGQTAQAFMASSTESLRDGLWRRGREWLRRIRPR